VQDRTGFARGTIAPRVGMSAAVPAMDPRPIRTMADMGMEPGAMGHGGTSDTGSGNSMVGMDHSAMPGMQHGTMPATNAAPQGHGTMADMPQDTGAARLEGHVGVDNVAMAPRNRLGEAGDGVDNNGRRVLLLTDLRSPKRGNDPRPPTREIVMHLTGNMERFMWSFDGTKFSDAAPIMLRLGERVRFTLINDTMMDHPMHMHGVWSELENGQTDYRPYKHTILVKPAERLSFLVSADEPGRWAFHCHLLYHMELGMMREVRIS
jgi:CopA family copper-resistance protein